MGIKRGVLQQEMISSGRINPSSSHPVNQSIIQSVQMKQDVSLHQPAAIPQGAARSPTMKQWRVSNCNAATGIHVGKWDAWLQGPKQHHEREPPRQVPEYCTE
jgi:hypothetical protein